MVGSQWWLLSTCRKFRAGGWLVSRWRAAKSMTMGPWIHQHQISSVDQTNLNGCLSLALEQLPQISDMAGPLGGPGCAHLGPGGAAKWVHGLLSRPLAPCVHICHLFAYFCYIFAHTNNFTSTSGTRWIINKILHMWWWFTSLYYAFRWNIDG